MEINTLERPPPQIIAGDEDELLQAIGRESNV